MIAAIFGAAFPMTGIAIVAMMIVDQIVLRVIPPLGRAFTFDRG